MTLIHTNGGNIKGFTKEGLNYFLGIPYANPPIYKNRFKHSKYIESRNDTIEAPSFKAINTQPSKKM